MPKLIDSGLTDLGMIRLKANKMLESVPDAGVDQVNVWGKIKPLTLDLFENYKIDDSVSVLNIE